MNKRRRYKAKRKRAEAKQREQAFMNLPPVDYSRMVTSGFKTVVTADGAFTVELDDNGLNLNGN